MRTLGGRHYIPEFVKSSELVVLREERVPVFFFFKFLLSKFQLLCFSGRTTLEPWTQCKPPSRQKLAPRRRRSGSRRSSRRSELFFLALLCFDQNFRTSMSLKLPWTTQTRPMRRLTRRSNATKTNTGGVMANNLKAKSIFSIFQITGRLRPLTNKRQDSARR